MFSAQDRYRGSVLRKQRSLWTGPAPPCRLVCGQGSSIALAIDTSRFDFSDDGLVHLHVHGGPLNLDGTHDVGRILQEDLKLVQINGCAYPGGCTYAPDEPWWPEDGVVSPCRAADGSRRVLCRAHGQVELFAHRRLNVPFPTLEKIADSGGYGVLGTRVERLATASQHCQDQGCFGYNHALFPSEARANCGG